MIWQYYVYKSHAKKVLLNFIFKFKACTLWGLVHILSTKREEWVTPWSWILRGLFKPFPISPPNTGMWIRAHTQLSVAINCALMRPLYLNTTNYKSQSPCEQTLLLLSTTLTHIHTEMWSRCRKMEKYRMFWIRWPTFWRVCWHHLEINGKQWNRHGLFESP